MLFAVSVTVNSTLTPSRFKLPGTTMPPMRKVRPCGASFAATCEGVKKNTRFFWKAASTSAAAMPSAATPTAIAVMRLCLGFTCDYGLAAGPSPPRSREMYPRRHPTRRAHTRPWRKIPSLVLQDKTAQAHQRYRDAVHPEGKRHDQHAGQHRRRHARRPGQADGRALVQRVPPLYRVIDDRDVHHADDREQRAGALRSSPVVDRRLQRHETEVQEQQDQLRRKARVPRPPGAPGRPAPERAGPQRDEGEQRAGGRQRARHHVREPRVESQADGRPERHHHVDEHRHPRRRDVDEDDAVGLALLRVGRRDEEADVKARRAEHCCRGAAPACDHSRDRIERLRRGIPEPLDALCSHSMEIRNAAAIAQGANAAATISSAASSRSCPSGASPAAAMSTLPAPMISTGTYSGSTSSDRSTPPPRSPSVRAAPIAPIKLSTGVRWSDDTASTGQSGAGRLYRSALSGAI